MATSRRTLAVTTLLLVALLAGGCSDRDAADDEAKQDAPTEPATTVDESELEEGDVEPTDLTLEEIDGSGVRGTVRIAPADGDALDIRVELEGDPNPTHGIEARVGPCADAVAGDLADEVIGDAASFTLADIEDGTMHDTATLPEDIVSEGTYTLLVYAGDGTDGDVAACVDVDVT